LSMGYNMPIYKLSIRNPIRNDGLAGDEIPDGEIGNICFAGPQTFLGYFNDYEATSKIISKDGVLYTGDLGYKNQQGLFFTGRAKFVIKPKGFQVFPGQIEDFICSLGNRIVGCAVVGFEHEVFSEEIMAFVETSQDAEITIKDLMVHAKGLAPYMRPKHYVLLGPGQIPINRLGKTDYLRLQEMAACEAKRLRLKVNGIKSDR